MNTTKITAASAYNLSKSPDRLLSIILKEIKFEASMGRDTMVFENSDTTEEAVRYIVDSLIDLGFKVTTSVINTSITVFSINWSKS